MKRSLSEEEKNEKRRKLEELKIIPYYDETHPNFKELHETKYLKLQKCLRVDLCNEKFHEELRQSFIELVENEIFQTFIIQLPNSKDPFPISVQRALLSEPGMTYKYFNTRLFGFPWKQVEHDSSIASKARYAFGKLNEILRDKGLQLRKEKLNTTSSDDSYEGCNYNVSLMNFFDPSQVKLESWKEDPFYKMGRMAITWHSDPCEPGSTVAVYQYDKYNCEQNKSSEWAVGIRPYWDVETPSLKFTFESGDAYFMLNGFNENFQHCVIAGTTIRFSSTHRRILTNDSTLEYISSLCANTIAEFDQNFSSDLASLNLALVEKLQKVNTEVECDWIREFWVLGEKNSQLNAFWSFHIQELELYWEKLEEQTQFVISTLRKLFNEETFSTPRDEKLWNLISILENHLTERETLRVKWKKRYSAPAYQNLAQIWRPIQRPKIKYELKKIIKKELPLWKSKLINS